MNLAAITFTILAFHACEQAKQRIPIDLSQSVSKWYQGIEITYLPITGVPAPQILYSTSGIKDWFDGVIQAVHPAGIFTIDHVGKQIIIAFRGTQEATERFNNLNPGIASSKHLQRAGFNGHLHAGYVNIFDSLVSQVNFLLDDALEQIICSVDGKCEIPEYSVLVTGHSLGGAVASIMGPYIAATRPKTAVHTIVFGAPHVGYEDFNTWACDKLATATSFERETDLAPSIVARVLGTRVSWDVNSTKTAGLPTFHNTLTTRRHLGTIVILPAFGHSWWQFPLAHSLPHYHYGVCVSERRPFVPRMTVNTTNFIKAIVGWMSPETLCDPALAGSFGDE